MKTTISKLLTLVPENGIEGWELHGEWKSLLKALGKENDTWSNHFIDDESLSFKTIFEATSLDFTLYCLRAEMQLYPICLMMLRSFASEVKSFVQDQEILSLYEQATGDKSNSSAVETFMAGVKMISRIEEQYAKTKSIDAQLHAMRCLVYALCQPKKAPLAARTSAQAAKLSGLEDAEAKLSSSFMQFFGQEFISDSLLEKITTIENQEKINEELKIEREQDEKNAEKIRQERQAQAESATASPNQGELDKKAQDEADELSQLLKEDQDSK